MLKISYIQEAVGLKNIQPKYYQALHYSFFHHMPTIICFSTILVGITRAFLKKGSLGSQPL
jgi:hypothetical protein